MITAIRGDLQAIINDISNTYETISAAISARRSVQGRQANPIGTIAQTFQDIVAELQSAFSAVLTNINDGE